MSTSPGRITGKAVGEPGLDPVPQPVAHDMHPGPVQRPLVYIQGDHLAGDASLHKIDGHIAVIGSDIRDRGALCHKTCHRVQSL